MNKLKLTTLSIAIALLAGCGSDEASDNTSNNGNTPNTSKNQVLLDKAANVSITDSGSFLSKCTGGVGNTYQTENLFIEATAANITASQLQQAGQIAQVALNELMADANLTSAELGLNNSRWTVCFNDPNGAGYSGSAYENRWEQHLKSDPSDLYRLAKHEMTHVAGFEFFGGETNSGEVYKWFTEALAVYIAQADKIVPAREIDNYASTSGIVSPITVDTYLTEDTVKQKYENVYDVYVTTIAVLSKKYGISVREWFDLYTQAKSSGDFKTAFDAFMAAKSATGITHTHLENLTNWKNLVADYVESDMSNQINIEADYPAEFVFIEAINYKNSGVSAQIGRSDVAATTGTVYYNGDSIADGTHKVFTESEISGKWYMIGPVNVEFSNGDVVNTNTINFKGAPKEEYTD
ncbi:hypothetical protein [Vibrio sp. LaRot3]|uniref:hypothetical protein n=1 Tax=Vibrio sp. LaRot3 TaxID=2998829 RepID=UPI0022CDC682|nr:hypothetical protein [Vibrio sp. LaRot3]MDA0149597.1 hypothetical protein [Vibrio sp. LaRot3]